MDHFKINKPILIKLGEHNINLSCLENEWYSVVFYKI